jgi:hypothetical protein
MFPGPRKRTCSRSKKVAVDQQEKKRIFKGQFQFNLKVTFRPLNLLTTHFKLNSKSNMLRLREEIYQLELTILFQMPNSYSPKSNQN